MTLQLNARSFLSNKAILKWKQFILKNYFSDI